MIELIFLILQFFIIYLLLSFNIFVCTNNNLYPKYFSFFENISFNSIIFLNFILVVSFFNVNLDTIIICYLVYLIILAMISLFKYKVLFFFNKENLIFFLVFFITSIIIFIEVANNLVIGWDAQKFWIYKMLNFYNGNSIDNLSNLPNPWYPYLGSLSWSFFWKVSFLENEYAGRLFYVFIYLLSLILLINNFKLSLINKIAFLFLIIMITYDYTIHSHWSMFSGYQEILIFSLVTIAMHFLYKLSNSSNKLENLNIMSILFITNVLVWIKHEGFVLALALILTLIFFSDLKQKKKINILLIFATIIFFRLFIFNFYDLNSSGIQHAGFKYQNINDIFEKFSLERILIILKYLFINIVANFLTIIGLILIFLSLITKKNIKKLYYIIFFAVFTITCFCFIYLISNPTLESENLEWMLKTGMDRMIYQLSPFTFLIFLEFINSKKLSN